MNNKTEFVEKPNFIRKEHYQFLDSLRKEGKDMCGLSSFKFVKEKFNLSDLETRQIIYHWIEEVGDGDKSVGDKILSFEYGLKREVFADSVEDYIKKYFRIKYKTDSVKTKILSDYEKEYRKLGYCWIERWGSITGSPTYYYGRKTSLDEYSNLPDYIKL